MRKRKSNLMLRLASLLLACVIISTYALCGLLARYTTSSSSDDSARVIKFSSLNLYEDPDGSFKDGKGFIIPGVDMQKDVTVSFGGSEAATYVFVELELVGDWICADKSSDPNEHTYTYKIISEKEVDDDNQPIVLMSFKIDESNWDFYKGNDNKYVYYHELEPNETDFVNKRVISQISGTNDAEIFVNWQITRKDMASLGNIEINFRAIAVQANGFENIEAAWNSVKDK